MSRTPPITIGDRFARTGQPEKVYVVTGIRTKPGEPPHAWGLGGPAVRLGLGSVRTLGEDVAERIEAERAAHGPYRDMSDLSRRVGLTAAQLEALATADAFACSRCSCRLSS